MGKRGRKVQRLDFEAISSAEKPQLSRKVGIVCHSMRPDGDGAGCYEVKLYVVDADLKSRFMAFESAIPAVRFIFPIRKCTHSVCVLESTVYIFGGYYPSPPDEPEPEVKEKYARKFALPEAENGNLKVKEKQLVRIPKMHYPKALPIALPTPNGKNILVLSGNILVEESSRAFELFDPKLCKWKKLPGFPSNHFSCCGRRRLSSTWVRCYSFIDEFHFFLQLDDGSFLLDLRKKKWTRVCIRFVPSRGRGLGNFVTAKSRYVLTSEGGVYRLQHFDFKFDIDGNVIASDNDDAGFFSKSVNQNVFYKGHPVQLYPFPRWKGKVKDNMPDVWSSIVRLYPNNFQGEEVCETCILQVQLTEEKGYEARLLLDVCQTELTCMAACVSNRVSLYIDLLENVHGIVLISL